MRTVQEPNHNRWMSLLLQRGEQVSNREHNLEVSLNWAHQECEIIKSQLAAEKAKLATCVEFIREIKNDDDYYNSYGLEAESILKKVGAE